MNERIRMKDFFKDLHLQTQRGSSIKLTPGDILVYREWQEWVETETTEWQRTIQLLDLLFPHLHFQTYSTKIQVIKGVSQYILKWFMLQLSRYLVCSKNK